MSEKHVARIKNHNIVHCLKCDGDDGTKPSVDGNCRLTKQNVMPYRQTCHECGVVVCEGDPSQAEGSRDLFLKENILPPDYYTNPKYHTES